MIKYVIMGLRGFFVLAAKIWSFMCYIFKRQVRAVIQHQTVKYDIIPLSPLSKHRLCMMKRKVLVLDLDETLIHSHHDGVLRQVKPGTPPDFVLKVTIDRHPVRFFVYKRPHVDFFLEMVSQWYDLVIFTASMEIYGAAVADKLDGGKNILRRRYYRQHCNLDMGSYTKDLSAINPDLSSIFILDNSPVAYRMFPDNAIPIKSWFSEPRDTALLCLLPMLDALRFCSDVRSVLGRNLHLSRAWYVSAVHLFLCWAGYLQYMAPEICKRVPSEGQHVDLFLAVAANAGGGTCKYRTLSSAEIAKTVYKLVFC